MQAIKKRATFRGIAAAMCIAIGVVHSAASAQAQPLPRRLPGPLTPIVNPPWNPCSPQVAAGFEVTCLNTAASKLPAAETTKYAAYRAGLLSRHLVMGRALSRTWLKEYKPSEDPESALAHGRAVTFSKPGLAPMTKIYVPWLDKSGQGSGADFIYGGDENPLLRGGLAMASFAMEYLATGNAESLQAALELLGYAEQSEFVTTAGERTGFFLRTRWKGNVDDNSGEAFFHASGDEITGLVLGLFWLNRALVEKAWTRFDDVARVKGMANRLGRQLQANQYFLIPPAELFQARQLGWSAMFAFRWFAEEAFADITGNRYAVKFNRQAFERIRLLPYKGSDAAKKVDEDMVKLITNVSEEYDAKQVAEAMPVFIGVMLNHKGADLRFSCHVTVFPAGGMTIPLPYQYFNFSMFLHMTNIVLQRNAEGKLNGIDGFKTQLRRLLRGVLYGKAATSFDLERFGLAYKTALPAVVSETTELALLTLPGRVITGGAVGGVLSAALGPIVAMAGSIGAVFSGCDLDGGWQLGSAGYEDLNYWALAISHAYDVMHGDSNAWFREQLPVKIDQVRAQFGPGLPLSERKNADKHPLVYDLAYDKVWGGLQYGSQNAKLIADHNPQGYIGTSFAWEQGSTDGSQDKRRFDGGNDGDEGLGNEQIAEQYARNTDVVREASGLDYLLPTALLAYRKGGMYLGDVKGSGTRTHARLQARSSVPDEAVCEWRARRQRIGAPVPSCGQAQQLQLQPVQVSPTRDTRVPTPVLRTRR